MDLTDEIPDDHRVGRRLGRRVADRRQAPTACRGPSAWSGSGTTRPCSTRPASPTRPRPSTSSSTRSTSSRPPASPRSRSARPTSGPPPTTGTTPPSASAARTCSQQAGQDFDFSDPCFVRAGEVVQSIVESEPFNEGFLGTSAQQGATSSAGLLANGKAAMELMGHWNPSVMAGLTEDEQGLGDDLGWFPFPTVDDGDGDQAAALGGGDGFSCSATAPPECADFLAYIMSEDVQRQFGETGVGIPTVAGTQDSVADENLAALATFRDDAPYVQLYLDTAYGPNVGGALNDAVALQFAGRGESPGRRRRRVGRRRGMTGATSWRPARPATAEAGGRGRRDSGGRRWRAATPPAAATPRTRRPRPVTTGSGAGRSCSWSVRRSPCSWCSCCCRSVRPPTTASSTGTGCTAIDDFVGLDNYREALSATRSSRARSSTTSCIVGLSIAAPAAARARRSRCWSTAGCAAAARCARSSSCRTSLAEVMAGVIWLLMLQPDGFVDQTMEAVGLGGCPAVGGRPRRRAVHADGRAHLEVRRVRDPAVPRRACRASRPSSRRPPPSTARRGGRPSGGSRSRCSARPSGSGSSCP